MNINKYIKQQDSLVITFTNELTDNIAKSLFNKRDNFNLLINNQLYKLWNDSWKLGRNHAVDEVRALFSYSSNIAEFAKQSPINKLGNEITQLNKERNDLETELNRIRREYQDNAGEYNPDKILRRVNRDRSYTGIEKVRAIQTMVNRENELTELIKAKDNLIDVKNAELDNLIREVSSGRTRVNNTNVNTQQTEQPRINKQEVRENINRADRQRNQFNSRYRNQNGSFNVQRYARDKGFDPNENPDLIRQQMQQELNDLNSEVNNNKELLKQRNQPIKRNNSIEEKQKREINKRTIQQQRLQTNRLSDDEIPAKIRDSVRAIESRRQTESTIGDVPLLQQTEFGKSYLDKRINVLTNDLNSKYRESLKTIVPNYLAGNTKDKDINYYRIISGMLTRQDSSIVNNYEKQLDLIKSKLSDVKTKEFVELNEINPYQRQEFRNTRYNPVIPLTVANKQLLNELPDKATYTRDDLKAYRDQLLEKVRKIKDNQSRTKRIALTEMGHAYNLGRLDYYVSQGIKFVKWNNSIEHKRRIAPDNYRRIYQKRFQNLNSILGRQSQLPNFEMDGVVCPICQERAIYDYGYGRGIIKVEDLLNNSQSQPLLHPHCFCFLTGYDESEVKQTINVPIYVSSLLNNNVVKWAATAILGTVAMYAAFKRTRTINVTELIPLNVSNQQLSEALINEVPIINVPLEPLRPLARIPNTVNLDRVNEVINPVVNLKRDYIDDVIDKADDVVERYEQWNPYVVETTKDALDRIDVRLNNYENFNKSNLNKQELKKVINQYKIDIDDLQYYINEIENSNTKLFSTIQSLKLVRKLVIDDALNTLTDDLIPPGYTREQVIVNNLDIRRLEDNILDAENTLRNAIGLQAGESSFYSQLKEMRDRLLSNETVKREYIKSKRSSLLTVQRNLAKQELPQQLGVKLDELNNNIVNNYTTITPDSYREYLNQLDVIESAIDKQYNLIIDKLTDVDLNLKYTLDKRDKVNINNPIIGSEFIKDYKTGLLQQKRKAIMIRNVLLNYKLAQ